MLSGKILNIRLPVTKKFHNINMKCNRQYRYWQVPEKNQ